jgi:hypothetical protein
MFYALAAAEATSSDAALGAPHNNTRRPKALI